MSKNKTNSVLEDSNLEKEITGMEPLDFSKKQSEKPISDSHRRFYDAKADYELFKKHYSGGVDGEDTALIEKLMGKIEVYIEEEMDIKESVLDEFEENVEELLDECDFEPGDYSDHRSHEDDDDWDEDFDYEEDVMHNDYTSERITLDCEDLSQITVEKVKEWALDSTKGPQYALEQLNRLPEEQREDILRQIKTNG